jgi:hypothetical protein
MIRFEKQREAEIRNYLRPISGEMMAFWEGNHYISPFQILDPFILKIKFFMIFLSKH